MNELTQEGAASMLLSAGSEEVDTDKPGWRKFLWIRNSPKSKNGEFVRVFWVADNGTIRTICGRYRSLRSSSAVTAGQFLQAFGPRSGARS
jgi:hypothetical protein